MQATQPLIACKVQVKLVPTFMRMPLTPRMLITPDDRRASKVAIGCRLSVLAYRSERGKFAIFNVHIWVGDYVEKVQLDDHPMEDS